MRLLLDTHALFWLLNQPSELGGRARLAIEDARNEILVSAVSAFEMATKHRIGKWPQVGHILTQFDEMVTDKRLGTLTVAVSHAIRAGHLDLSHRDPFDRLLMGQALVENLMLVSNEAVFDRFGVTRVWD